MDDSSYHFENIGNSSVADYEGRIPKDNEISICGCNTSSTDFAFWKKWEDIDLLVSGQLSNAFQNWIFPLLFVIGVIGNLLNLAVLTSKSQRVIRINLILSAMAIVEICYFLAMLPLQLQGSVTIDSYQRFLFYGAIPLVVLSNTFSATSIWLTVCITVERAIAIKCPLLTRLHWSPRRVMIGILGITLACLVISSYPLATFKMVKVTENHVFEPTNPSLDINSEPIVIKPRTRYSLQQILITEKEHPFRHKYVRIASIIDVTLKLVIPFIAIVTLNTILIIALRRRSTNPSWKPMSLIAANDQFASKASSMSVSPAVSRRSPFKGRSFPPRDNVNDGEQRAVSYQLLTVARTISNSSRLRLPFRRTSFSAESPPSQSLEEAVTNIIKGNGRRRADERKITVMAVVLVVAFFILNMPSGAISLYDKFKPEHQNNCPPYRILYTLAAIFINVGKAINFVLYCSASRHFRQRLIQFLCPKRVLSWLGYKPRRFLAEGITTWVGDPCDPNNNITKNSASRRCIVNNGDQVTSYIRNSPTSCIFGETSSSIQSQYSTAKNSAVTPALLAKSYQDITTKSAVVVSFDPSKGKEGPKISVSDILFPPDIEPGTHNLSHTKRLNRDLETVQSSEALACERDEVQISSGFSLHNDDDSTDKFKLSANIVESQSMLNNDLSSDNSHNSQAHHSNSVETKVVIIIENPTETFHNTEEPLLDESHNLNQSIGLPAKKSVTFLTTLVVSNGSRKHKIVAKTRSHSLQMNGCRAENGVATGLTFASMSHYI